MSQVRYGLHSRQGVERAQPPPKVRILADRGVVELHPTLVHGVMPIEGGEEAQVRLGRALAPQEPRAGGAVGRELRLEALQGLEVGDVGPLIRVAVAGEAGLVAAIVDVGVDPRLHLLDLGLEAGGEQVAGRLAAEGRGVVGEHPDNFGALVADDTLLLLVVQDGDAGLVRDAARLVHLLGQLLAQHRVDGALLQRDVPPRRGVHALGAELPPAFLERGVLLGGAVGEQNVERDRALKPVQSPG
mmetsp:Transcript_37751/g.94657  ORF Transcript_37751/g.94657 Transcript_37751/m.94657 type:complete len:244 (-) Transcript_37751:409-1140(-)